MAILGPVTPSCLSQARVKSAATCSGGAAPGLVTGGGGLSGVGTLSFPAVGPTLLLLWDGSAAGPTSGALCDVPVNDRAMPTAPSTSRVSTSAIP